MHTVEQFVPFSPVRLDRLTNTFEIEGFHWLQHHGRVFDHSSHSVRLPDKADR